MQLKIIYLSITSERFMEFEADGKKLFCAMVKKIIMFRFLILKEPTMQ